jgi:hypothetical protein
MKNQSSRDKNLPVLTEDLWREAILASQKKERKYPEAITTTELSSIIGFSASQTQRIVARLVASGLAIPKKDYREDRNGHAKLTPVYVLNIDILKMSNKEKILKKSC